MTRNRATEDRGRVDPLLDVDALAVRFPGERGVVDAVKDVSLTVGRGERVGIVGESGSGKSVTGRAIAGLLPVGVRIQVYGVITFDGSPLLGAAEELWHDVRSRRIGLIFQDPLTYLNPVMKIGVQVREAVRETDRTRAHEQVL
ncbi:MAG: ATP-binding cassette domain-containing protein, partial [Pseudoclavibacter sp.]